MHITPAWCEEQFGTQLRAFAADLHSHPELSFEETRTTQKILQALQSLPGVEVLATGAKTGAVARLAGGEGPAVALRADIDAIPQHEAVQRPDASVYEGKMHACGHDMHTAILLGAAEVLKRHEQELPCRVKLVFQPGEELGTGAQSLVEAGLLENPHVDAAAALHVDSTMAVGECSYCTGVATSDIYDIFIQLKGKGGHSSQPEETINALAAANGVFQALSGLVQREVSGFDTAILAICSMHAGSQQNPNIIPEICEMAGTLRCFDRALGQRLVERIREIVEREAACYRAEGTVETLLTPSLTVDPSLAEQLVPALQEVFGAEHVVRSTRPFAGSEDFSYIAQQVPAFFCWIGAGKPGNPMLHNPNIIFDEQALEYGVKAMVTLPFVWAGQTSM